jgi:hypothetical protein
MSRYLCRRRTKLPETNSSYGDSTRVLVAVLIKSTGEKDARPGANDYAVGF